MPTNNNDIIKKSIIKYAKSHGYLTPLWLLPTSGSQKIQRAFQELENFLYDAYVKGEITNITLDDINDFIWDLKKTFTFEGWEGIAPLLLVTRTHHEPLTLSKVES